MPSKSTTQTPLHSNPVTPRRNLAKAMQSLLIERATNLKLRGGFDFFSKNRSAPPMTSEGPDTRFYPGSVPEGRSKKWPTVVLETGKTENLARLQKDAESWLVDSSGDVRIFILLIEQPNGTVRFEKWVPEEVHEYGPSGTGGPKVKVVAERDQTVVVGRARGGRVEVIGGPLVLEFAEVCLDEPQRGQDDAFVFGDAELADLVYGRRACTVDEYEGYYEDADADDEGGEHDEDDDDDYNIVD
ncbi:hypothetical protein BO94DRAFT_579249 [Aspergillus sclerotioniger CBS 115572]|uniref:Uncharacterized protein n=1 Tax=Aspergillus sclerotioniger CBS 115572 TaxID=1450535 RepID=A0A317V4G0_9EURO|nr:hypothetical protein BO94DRAFT_579249 [Aspergillus sclerotioniger CBS 115572]PWY68985.1 hypothetical protein BO94DRAFT_579249 [Aspergillus sclerotioniger CBS 115572]